MSPRDHLKSKFPRCHYNKSGKTKQIFTSEIDAEQYLIKMNLKNYTIYQCKYCNYYHIAH